MTRLNIVLAAALGIASIVPCPAAAQPAARAGSGSGFVRINGTPVNLKFAYAVTAPDAMTPSEMVHLVLMTPAPIASEAIAKAKIRRDLFSLVDAGAIVEIRERGHSVFLNHPVLKGQQLQTGGDPKVATTANRVSGSVNTFMSGEEESFGFKVRFELTFDAPILNRLPLGKPEPVRTAAAPATPAPGPAPRSKAEAVKWLERQDRLVGPTPHDGLISYLTFLESWNTDVVRAYLLAGAAVTKHHTLVGGYALNTAALMCEGKPNAAEIVTLLLDAGASVNQKDADGARATPPMLAVRCPDVLKLILAAKPDLNLVDVRGFTVMHHALSYGPDKITAPMLRDAGFDIARWTPSLKDAGLSGDLASALAPAARPSAPPASPPAAAPRAAATAARTPAALDWKALGPYPQRSKAEATRVLSRPGAATTIDDHFWDGITSHEPQRLALAVQAGANIRATRAATGYTPLVLMAERCDLSRDGEAQVSIAEQLVAAGADLTGLDANKANALTVGAGNCPLGVITALIRAGVGLAQVSAVGTTPLKTAIMAGRVDVVDALLDAGVDQKKEPYNVGRTASGNKAIEAALKKKRK